MLTFANEQQTQSTVEADGNLIITIVSVQVLDLREI